MNMRAYLARICIANVAWETTVSVCVDKPAHMGSNFDFRLHGEFSYRLNMQVLRVTRYQKKRGAIQNGRVIIPPVHQDNRPYATTSYSLSCPRAGQVTPSRSFLAFSLDAIFGIDSRYYVCVHPSCWSIGGCYWHTWHSSVDYFPHSSCFFDKRNYAELYDICH